MSLHASVDALVQQLQKRDLISSRQTALETAQLLYRYVGAAKFTSIEGLIDQIKAVGRKLVEANRHEPAVGNIIRKVLRLIREEYRSAYSAYLASQGIDDPRLSAETLQAFGGAGHDSNPGTPLPPSPGLSVPSNHFLSDDYKIVGAKSSASGGSAGLEQAGSSGGQNAQGLGGSRRPSPLSRVGTSLSNFVQMRHTRAQLERAGSALTLSTLSNLEHGLAGLGITSLDSSPVNGSPAVSEYGGAATGDGVTGRRAFSPGSHTPEEAMAESSSTSAARAAAAEFSKRVMGMKPVLMDAIREVIDEVETTHETVAKGAREHIHSSEIILTIGCSRTVEAFLKTAKKDRDFTVIVAETSPSYLGHVMARNLAKHGIQTVLVPDSAVFALMPRVTKVILGAHSVLANGGMFNVAGTLGAAVAAKYHSTPLVVVTGQYKLSPARNTYHEHAALDYGDPEFVLGYKEGAMLDKVEDVSNPFYEYIRPDLVGIYITNEGDHAPAYIYKLTQESYDEEDQVL